MSWIASKSVKRSSLHIAKPLLLRWNITPFILLYVACLYTYFFHYDQYFDYPLFVVPVIGLLHALSILTCIWSVHFRTALTCSSTNTVKQGVLVKIIPVAEKGGSVILPVELREHDQQYFISWRKTLFFWNQEKKTFEKVAFPTRLPLTSYLESQGYTSQDAVSQAQAKYGSNKFDIPMPEFLELYKEQAVAPFFIFQIFCVLLWCLDEYWYYSLLTLFMLLIFEGTMVAGRLKNLTSLRNMIQPPHSIYVFRGRQWLLINSHDIIPGDICSIVRQQADTLLPCDFLILRGTCVVNEAMLTGESTPQIKEPLDSVSTLDGRSLNMKSDRLHILFGGTNVINHSADGVSLPNAPKTPDQGCIAYALRTGFETNQGKLIRTILFSSDRVTANNLESLLFILFLLIFAIAAAAYVFMSGWEDPEKSKYKLVIECTLIITSVVPPELPMELSLAVNTSLVALAKLGIYCTEPFRIPFAGKTNVCCFDKTGTLTDDKLILKGIAGTTLSSSSSGGEQEQGVNQQIIAAQSAADWTQFAIAGCNSLMYVDQMIVGDPMEVAALSAINWEPINNNTIKKKDSNSKIKILHRFHFESALKRMSTIATTESNNPTTFVSMKGAPEEVAKHLEVIPPHYEQTFRYFSCEGFRVLAIAYKTFGKATKFNRLSRTEIEQDLTFCGFLIFDCPIKPDSIRTIQILNASSHKTVMITGDNTLTACNVAQKLEILQKNCLILEKKVYFTESADRDENEELLWTSIDETERFPMDQLDIATKYHLCVSGDGLQALINAKLFSKYLDSIRVYARVSPEQKETITVTLKKAGNFVLMCGDGTNDVGALKQAHIGIALLNNAPLAPVAQVNNAQAQPAQVVNTSRGREIPRKKETSSKKTVPAAGSTLSAAPPAQGGRVPPGGARRPRRKPAFGPPSIVDDEEIARVKLGDASIASPFTMKGTSVFPVTHIIRQGRCTLVTTLQMFMILALNCLISAYSMSVLYHDGYRMADSQATVMGVLVAFCFLFISRSKPLDQLSKLRPASTIFTMKFFTSLLGQFAIHLTALIYVHNMASLESPERIKLEEGAPFTPSLLNSAVFLISSTMHVSTFAVNYRGHPFMQSLFENKPLLGCLSVVSGITVLAALQVSPEITQMLELVTFTPEFQQMLVSIIVADFVGAFVWDRLMSLIFGRL